ncbi:hypothetical protein HCN44_005146 [Aphidius gifuensis]|uniref:Protein sleepless n=1 Tax=Aphidius gifuensis TaxID=684658 RepID=A0A834XUN1_APHGI|nr:uncharacterized protein LOC122852399 [Aphidius gifuensis]KAF7992802.1 hypothetical protein HCN44_005146 [Aphidius gifuensis]
MPTIRNNVENYFLIFSFIIIFQRGESIKCYDCDSSTDQRCLSDEEQIKLTDCSSLESSLSIKGISDELDIFHKILDSSFTKNSTKIDNIKEGIPQIHPACYKLIAEINGITIAKRGCTFKEGFGLICDMITSANGIIRFCAPCDSHDGCNSSTTNSFTSVLLILSILSSFYFFASPISLMRPQYI